MPRIGRTASSRPQTRRPYAVPDPAAGTPGFGRTSNAAYGAGAKESGARSNVSNATRKKRVTRAAAKIRTARGELRGLRSAFDELRDFATATQAALFRARRTENGVARQLQSTAGYAEETTARLKQTSQAHKQAQMTAKQLGEALDAVGAKRLVVGHTPQQGGVSSGCGGRLWRSDVGVSRGIYGAKPQVIEIVNGRVRVLAA